MIANLSQNNDSQHFSFRNIRGYDQSEEILLGMIRGACDMTPNNVISNGMSASRVDVNTDLLGLEHNLPILRRLEKTRKAGVKTK